MDVKGHSHDPAVLCPVTCSTEIFMGSERSGEEKPKLSTGNWTEEVLSIVRGWLSLTALF
jgi:hypothetical protein